MTNGHEPVPPRPPERGDFVRLGTSLGVVTRLAGEGVVPDEHVGVWFGTQDEHGQPLVISVPDDYVLREDRVAFQH